MDLINFVKILLKRKLLIIGVPLLSMCISYFLLKHTPNSYKSRAKIATGITDEFKTSIEDSDSRKPHVIANKFSNLIQLIKSRSVIDLLSYRLIMHDLKSDFTFRENGDLLNGFIRKPEMDLQVEFKAKYDSLAMLTSMTDNEKMMIKILEEKKYDYKNLIEKIKVYRLEISDFIEIEFESENPNLSSFVVNELIAEFIKYYTYMSREKSSNSVNFFSELAEQKKIELDQKVEIMKNYKLNNGIINLYEQTEAIVDQIAKVEIMREKDQKLINSLSLAISTIDKKLNGRDQQFTEASRKPFNRNIALLKEKINKLNGKKIRGLIDQKSAEDSLSILRSQLNQKVVSLTDELVVDPNVSMQTLVLKKLDYILQLDIAQKSVESIDRELSRLYQVAASFAPSEALISSYEREITVAEEVYILMLNKLNTATLNSLNLAGSINQIERAIPAEKPEASKKLLLMILAGIGSFVFTVVILFVLEYLDLTIKSPAEFNLLANLPLLGVINRIKLKAINLHQTFSDEDQSSELKIYKQLLRLLRSEIEKGMQKNKTLLISSTKEGTGKSILSSSLAYSLNLTGKRILLIDANLSNNTLTRQFGVEPTLEKILLNQISLQDGIKLSSAENIFVIGCEQSPKSLIEINGRNELHKLVEATKDMFDLILIEGPPLNNYSDSKDILEIVDKFLLVFSSTNVLTKADKASIEYAKTVTDKLLGGILNNLAEEHLEPVLGEIPKKRSSLRVMVKKLLNRDFGKKVKPTETKISL